MIDQVFIEKIAKETSTSPAQVKIAIDLFDAGATIPYVARYERDATENLKEHPLEIIYDRNLEARSFLDQRTSIHNTLEKQDKLNPELRERILACTDTIALDDLYLPYKSRRRTTVAQAKSQGLEPLADYIWERPEDDISFEEKAAQFVNPEKDINSTEKALEGARHILAERIALDSETRQHIRDHLQGHAKITSSSTKNAENKQTKYQAYYSFTEPIASIPSHRVLAIRRGVKEGFLRMDIIADDAQLIDSILARYVKKSGAPSEPTLRLAVEDAYNRLLRPYIQNEIMNNIRNRAETDAITVFRKNAENLLMAAPAGPIPLIAVLVETDGPCLCAIFDPQGALVEHTTLNLPPPDSENGAENPLLELAKKHAVRAIVLADRPQAKPIMKSLRALMGQNSSTDPYCILAGETPAIVYANSKIADEECPDTSHDLRILISIARRLQDPLAELVKIEPRAIGVGQYQHDANQKRLREGLHRTLVSCVNKVGVNLNTAPVSLLRLVSGIQYGAAQNIVAFREKIQGFKNREQLNEVDGIGPKVFEQCAGFLRIIQGDNPLDATRIHPKHYPLIETIAAAIDASARDILENPALLEDVDLLQHASDSAGPATLRDIRNELRRAWRDPRAKFRVPKFIEGVHSIDDLTENMLLEGVITNITDFGAFVDIGIDHDGLIHLSELANRYVRDPHDIVRIGDIVKIKVIKVEKNPSRISLSMKAIRQAADRKSPHRRPDRKRRPTTKTPNTQQTQGASPKSSRRPPQGERRNTAPAQSTRNKPAKKRPQRPPKSPTRTGKREQGKPVGVSGKEDRLNTLLADQLAHLKDKIQG